MADKEHLIHKIQAINDVALLAKIEQVIEDNEMYQLHFDDDYIKSLLYEGEDKDEPLQIRAKAGAEDTAFARYESKTAFPVFAAAFAMLILAGAIILLLAGDKPFGQFLTVSGILSKIYVVFWLAFLLDFIMTMHLVRKESIALPRTELVFRIFSLLFPPLRLGSRSMINPDMIWLPFWNWSRANYALFDKLRRTFSVPMIIIALLIVPVLVVEWKFYDYVAGNYPAFPLDLLLQLLQAFIWIAFTFEFILMFSVTNDKLDYCKRNWIDILIILLPLISFFRTLRLIRIARLNHLARGYKMRGVLMKARQGLVLADFFQRLIYPNPKIHLKTVQKKMNENRREREELNRQWRIAAERLSRKGRKK